ncbi:hypothetical protein [Sphingomonas sp. DT-204]|uniref:hypothetical protein n=1 Tax=Sphingomonas sp. DT-204 TaxID=3396166 RepID=UPI003F1E397A
MDGNASAGFVFRTLVAIRLRARFFANFPHAGRPFREQLRVLDTAYLLLYRLRGDAVEILRAHHEREDWQVEL